MTGGSRRKPTEGELRTIEKTKRHARLARAKLPLDLWT